METPPATHPPSGIPAVVALMAVFYAAVATVAAGAAAKTMAGTWSVPLGWAVVWAILGGFTAVGLAQLKPWARALARVSGLLLAALALWMAAAFLFAGRPLAGIGASFFAGLHVAGYYYLRRPVIRAFFV